MPRLPLEYSRWRDLECRLGRAGALPHDLQKLIDNPADRSLFDDLWPALCSEGTTWPAAFAAAPYLVDIAERLSPADRWDYVMVVGFFAMNEGSCPAGMRDAYDDALRRALPLLLESLSVRKDEQETVHQLASAAALLGYKKLALAIEYLDTGCPECGHSVIGGDPADARPDIAADRAGPN